MSPVPPKPERPSPEASPSGSVNKKAKCTAPPVPSSISMPPPEAPLKKTKTEKACAVKGAGRPPATPLASPLACPVPPPVPVTGHARMVLPPPPPPPKASATAAAPAATCPGIKSSPATPPYVSLHGVPVPKAGVKLEIKPTQNAAAAAAAMRRQKARPTMKVEHREETPPPQATATSPRSSTDTSPTSTSITPTSQAKAISPSSTPQPAKAIAAAAPIPAAKCPAPTPTPDGGETTETDIQREDRVRAWVCKMDDVEIKCRIEKIKAHSLFPQYELWRRAEIFGLGEDDDEDAIPSFGSDDEEEELVSWLMWLEERPSVENALPDPNPQETAAVAVAEQPKRVTFENTVTVHCLPEQPGTAAPAKAYTSILKPAAKHATKPLALAPAPPMKAITSQPPAALAAAEAAPKSLPATPSAPATETTLPVAPPPATHAAPAHVPAPVPTESLAMLPSSPPSASPAASSPIPAAPANPGMIPPAQLASQIHVSAPVS
eukprot:s2950_g4.t1